MKRTTRRLLGPIALAVCALVAVSGCASIPQSGTVHEGVDIDASGSGFDTFDYIPAGPVDGATQEQLIRGFIRAALSPQDDFKIARSYLTPAFSREWNPEASITVYDVGGRSAMALGNNSWKVSVEPVAFVNDEGGYRTADRMSSVTQSYSFQKVDGQWRISSAPDGTLIDSSSFTNVYSGHTLYYFDTTDSFLVPDRRWFASGTTTPTRIVKALLAGPSSWLKGAVSTAFPQGTQLGYDSVQVVDGVAEVALSNAANAASNEQLRRMKLQLQRSLSEITAIQAVTMSVNDVSQVVAPPGDTPLRNPAVDSRPLVMTNGHFGFASQDGLKSIPYVSDPLVGLDLVAVSLSADRVQAAALSDAGVFRVSGGSAQLLDAREDLVIPTIDPEGFIWSTSNRQGADISAFGADGIPITVERESSESHPLAALSMSRDGTRLAFLIEGDGETRLMVSGVLRSQYGVPERLGKPLEIARFTNPVSSLTWVDELTVAVLESDSGKKVITSQEIGGRRHTATAPQGTTTVVGAGGIADYWILTDNGIVQSPQGSGWQELSEDVSLLATQTGTPH